MSATAPSRPADSNVRDLTSRGRKVKKELQAELRAIHVRLGIYVQGYMESDEWAARCGEIRREFWSSKPEQRSDYFWRFIQSKLEDRESIVRMVASELGTEFREQLAKFDSKHSEARQVVNSALKGQGELEAIVDIVLNSVEEMNRCADELADQCRRRTAILLRDLELTLARLERCSGQLYEKLDAEAAPLDQAAANAPGRSGPPGRLDPSAASQALEEHDKRHGSEGLVSNTGAPRYYTEGSVSSG